MKALLMTLFIATSSFAVNAAQKEIVRNSQAPCPHQKLACSTPHCGDTNPKRKVAQNSTFGTNTKSKK
jgi:hypothetical protein